MNVMLRPWTRSDARARVTAAASSPDLAPQFGGVAPNTLATAEAFIDESLRFTATAKNWAVVEDDIAVGNIGASAIEFRHESAWMSYWIALEARGKGYATTGLLAASDWAFCNGLYRLELGHRVNNPASCRVATAAGYQREGLEREKLRYGDNRYDVETHARLASDPTPHTHAPALPLVV